MRAFQSGPEEAAQRLAVGEQDKEKASLEALIDYAIQCAMETNVFSADERLDDVRRNLCRAVL
ncbi:MULTISPECIES: hypothetical protein [unclassified Pseudophaeobacter]|uniref:hypothetical protein n=1 Tax=unclassified Pseudophaeobacter TaxID=2637024 RepID=UPI000EFB9726|nr:hypothetical protein [Pseudophaeobacter sp. EL27]